jgi:alpha-beta hydrolase superfamily lysophospholipase
MLVAFVAVLAGMIAFGTGEAPRPLTSVSEPFKHVDFSDLPQVETIATRDGSPLAFRFYAANTTAPPEQVAIVIHGSSATGASLHPLAKALREAGIAVYAPDIRGHGATGRRGDIDRPAQLDEDMVDLVAAVRTRHPQARLKLLGFSSGGGFALHIAGSELGGAFERAILLSPFLGPYAPTMKPQVATWATAFIPRIIALTILDRLGFHAFEYLPTVAFAVAPEYADISTSSYSYRLMKAFGTTDYAADLRDAKPAISVLAGEDDELFFAEKFAPTVKAVRSDASVQTIPGIVHVTLTLDPRALSEIVRAVRGT